MGIFNFDFGEGRGGNIRVSRQWWIYLILTIPSTIAAIAAFWVFERGENEKETKQSQDTSSSID
jgi:hypothetical protein